MSSYHSLDQRLRRKLCDRVLAHLLAVESLEVDRVIAEGHVLALAIESGPQKEEIVGEVLVVRRKLIAAVVVVIATLLTDVAAIVEDLAVAM